MLKDDEDDLTVRVNMSESSITREVINKQDGWVVIENDEELRPFEQKWIAVQVEGGEKDIITALLTQEEFSQYIEIIKLCDMVIDSRENIKIYVKNITDGCVELQAGMRVMSMVPIRAVVETSIEKEEMIKDSGNKDMVKMRSLI